MPNNPILSPEDYVEPACLLCGDPLGAAETIKPIPQQRVIAMRWAKTWEICSAEYQSYVEPEPAAEPEDVPEA